MARNIPVQSFKLDQQGLAHIFGELEAKLVEAVWELEEASVQDVIDHLGGDLNYKTTMTVLARLVDKGVLNRQKTGRAFVYTAAASRQDLLAGVFDRMVRGMLDENFRQIALAQMVETIEAVDPKILEELNQLIQQRKEDAEER
jgi:predicted transcriptional regulator